MSLLASTPGGFRRTGWWPMAGVTTGFCLGPAVLAAMSLWLGQVVDPDRLSQGFTQLRVFLTLLLVSPLLSWPFWTLIGASAAVLMERGTYGALVAMGLGAAFGGATGALVGQPLSVSLAAIVGAILATFHRFALAMLRPLAF